jgi:hypothetical protein
MKCPRCWADKAYLRRVEGWRGLLVRLLLVRPMRCHHCYHKFCVPWPLTLGQRVDPPEMRIVPFPRSARRKSARQPEARGERAPRRGDDNSRRPSNPGRADAA